MSEIGPLNWSDLGVSELVPTGTVTLLLADVEGSTRLWQTQPEAMTAAIAALDRTLAELVATYRGVRPVEQGEGDSFVIAFSRASDAVACALALQRAPLAPLRLRMGLHTGEVQLRDEGNYVGPTINRTGRLRSLAHGGQTIMSATTSDLVIDHLPADVWLADLGSHTVRDLPRPEHITQLCHPDLVNEFPPLRTSETVRVHNLPTQLTSFVGRVAEMAEVRQIVTGDRLVTLTGAGGVGKTRLAVEVAAQLVAGFGGGVWYVDLAPITNPDVVQLSVARAFGLPDQTGRSTMDALMRFLSGRHALLVLDNCEHLLDSSGELIVGLLGGCPQLTILTTSREPIGVAGEITWRVPSLALADEAIHLFTDRARRARPNFHADAKDGDLVADICRRLDGMPLAIELAAARIRALSLPQIAESLHDRFRLLTGGARTSVRRQQTLRASVDWSHALLTESERVLLRRLGVFLGGFDLAAAQAVGASSPLEQYQIVDQLSLLVDKSLVVAEDRGGVMRYRLLETVRQYALEKLGESGDADAARGRHRDYYTNRAIALARQRRDDSGVIEWSNIEIDNLRAAFAWSLENAEVEPALTLASALQWVWVTTSRVREGLRWLDAALTDNPQSGVAPDVWVRAVADHSELATWLAVPASLARAEQALAIARQLEDAALIVGALRACGTLTVYDAATSRVYYAEAAQLARATDNKWMLCQICRDVAMASSISGDPGPARAAAEEGRDLADALGDRLMSGFIRVWLGIALKTQGHLAEAGSALSPVADQAIATGHHVMTVLAHVGLGRLRAAQGDTTAARASAQAAREAAAAMGGFMGDMPDLLVADAALADGDGVEAKSRCEESLKRTVVQRSIFVRSLNPISEALLACGELVAARKYADENVAMVPGWHKMVALNARAHIALAQGEYEQSERDAHDALAIAAHTGGYGRLPDVVECLARLAAADGKHQHAARLFGAAHGMRRRTGEVRFKVYQAEYESCVASVHEALGDSDFDAAWAEGAALSTEEAIAYAQRGRGERKRPTSGWGSLTPTERDVVRLVSEGLGNKEIGEQLFISPRTVQTHLTHIYTKLGFSSRVQLAQEAARHS